MGELARHQSQPRPVLIHRPARAPVVALVLRRYKSTDDDDLNVGAQTCFAEMEELLVQRKVQLALVAISAK